MRVTVSKPPASRLLPQYGQGFLEQTFRAQRCLLSALMARRAFFLRFSFLVPGPVLRHRAFSCRRRCPVLDAAKPPCSLRMTS